jgi:hypothetical protein
MSSVRERIDMLGNRSFVTELSLECERLNVLDDLWTVYLAEADPQDEAKLQDDLPALQSIIGEMVQLLTSVSRKSRELSQLVREFPSDLDRELELLVSEHPAREWLMEAKPTNLSALVIDACTAIEQESPHAIVELAEKLKRVADGEFEQGDFRINLKCAIIVVGLGSAALAVCATPGFLIALPAAVVGGAGLGGIAASGIAAIKGWSCKHQP